MPAGRASDRCDDELRVAVREWKRRLRQLRVNASDGFAASGSGVSCELLRLLAKGVEPPLMAVTISGESRMAGPLRSDDVESAQARFEEVARMPNLEERVAMLEGRVEEQAMVMADVRAVGREIHVSMRDVRDELTRQLTLFREEMNRRFEQVDQRFEQMDRRLEQIDRRFEQTDVRTDGRFAAVERRFEAVDRRFDRMERYFAWVTGLLGHRIRRGHRRRRERLLGSPAGHPLIASPRR